MPHRRPPRLPQTEYLGIRRILLTMCTFDRLPYFTSPSAVEATHGELLRTAAAYDVEVIAYCFMPDHLHALFHGAGAATHLEKCAAMFRQRSGHAHRRHSRMRLWQEGYHDRILRDEESTFDVVSYIVGNPVRAGLCSDVRLYPYAGSSRYSLEELAVFVQWRPH
ncbi:MAG: transposase [Acidobacteriia bacterium]|nr:transposase [Terriglobia bacterium]